MITKEFKQKWLTALTDGSYWHTCFALKDDNGIKESRFTGHCCLGVAVELVGETISGSSMIAGHEDDEYDGFVPPAVADKMGLTLEDQYKLATLNDAAWGAKFPQTVIDYITTLPEQEEATA